jgi:hypothetical protein
MRNPFKKPRKWHIAIRFSPREFWIGLYWQRMGNFVDVWVCLLPMVPIHVSWWWGREPAIPEIPAIPSIASTEIISAVTVESAKAETIVAIQPQSKWIDTRPTNSGSRFF